MRNEIMTPHSWFIRLKPYSNEETLINAVDKANKHLQIYSHVFGKNPAFVIINDEAEFKVDVANYSVRDVCDIFKEMTINQKFALRARCSKPRVAVHYFHFSRGLEVPVSANFYDQTFCSFIPIDLPAYTPAKHHVILSIGLSGTIYETREEILSRIKVAANLASDTSILSITTVIKE